MRIRHYDAADAEDLARIYREAALHTAARAYSPAQLEAWADTVEDLDAFARRLRRGLTLVAENAEGETVAFGQLEPHDRVALLYTAPGYARASYASTIYRALEDRARAAGVEVLHTASSRAARPFFEKQGFELVASEQARRRGVTLERFRMTKILSEPAGPGA